jgi:hypothetical protein
MLRPEAFSISLRKRFRNTEVEEDEDMFVNAINWKPGKARDLAFTCTSEERN